MSATELLTPAKVPCGFESPMRKISHDDFTSLVGEGFHTAFRKGTDHPSSAAIWRMIRDLPREEWGTVIDWVVMGITDGKQVTIEAKPPPKLPRDPSQRAKAVVDKATGRVR